MRRRSRLALVRVLTVTLLTVSVGIVGAIPGGAAFAQAKKVPISWMTWGTTQFLDLNMNALYKVYPEMRDKIEFTGILGGPGDFQVAEKFRLALAAHQEVPDIIQFNRTQLPEFGEAGVLEDLTPYLKAYVANVVPAALQLATYQGKILAFPYQVKLKLWYYRKDLFDEAGIDPEKVRTLDEFIAAGKKLHAKFPKSYIWNLGPTPPQYNLGMLFSGNGTKFLNAKGEYVVGSDPGVRKAFQAFKTMKDAGIVADISDFTRDWEQGLADGTIASSLIASWFIAFLPRYAPNLRGKWEITQWPVIADADGGSEAGGSIQVVPKAAKHKQEAIDLLTKMFLTKKGALSIYAARFYTPNLKDALGDPLMRLPDPYFGRSEIREEVKALEKFKVFDFDPAASREMTILNQALIAYLTTNTPLDGVLKQAEADLRNQIGNPWRR